MLGRDLELARNVVLHQLAEKGVVMVGHHVIIPQAGAHKDLFDAFNLPQFAQQIQVIRMIGLQAFTGRGEQAALVLAKPMLLDVYKRQV